MFDENSTNNNSNNYGGNSDENYNSNSSYNYNNSNGGSYNTGANNDANVNWISYGNQPNDVNNNSNNEKQPKKKKFVTYKSAIVMLVICVLVSAFAGYAGGLLSIRLNDDNSATTLNNGSNDYSNNDQLVNNTAQLKDKNKDVNAQPVTDNSEGAPLLSVTDVVEKTANSVVEITTEIVTTGNVMQQFISQGAGSGVIISEDGYIVTNNHVIDGANKIMVKLNNGENKEAELIATDYETDLAVIKIEAENLTPIVYGDSSTLKVGDTAIAIGNPLGELGGTVTVGIISALDREISIEGEVMTLLQTDAAVNPGNSGGALVNSAGELIGIVNAKSSGSDVEGLGFAIPVNTVKNIVSDLIEYGYVKGRITVGMTVVDVSSPQLAWMYRVNDYGVYVYEVNNGSPADKAGLKMGDKIISIDGTEVNSSSDLNKIFDSHKIGDIVNVDVQRGLSKKTISITLEEYNPNK